MPEEKDKKLEYLNRGEVKTMQKDIAGLREVEANQERKKISQIKTEEEVQRERERREKAEEAARERKLAQEETVRKEEERKRLREAVLKEDAAPASEPRQGRELGPEEFGQKRDEARAGGFKGTMREIQDKEEEERKRFLERIEEKAKSKEELPSPLLPPPLPPPAAAAPEKKIPKPFLRRPSFLQKLWIRIVLTLLLLAILATMVTFWYWYLRVRESPAPAPPAAREQAKQELIIPAALISTQAFRILEIPLLDEFLKEDLGENQFTRLIIKDPQGNKALGLKEFFEAFEVSAPATFYNKVNNDFTLFVYSSRGVNRLGLITEVKEPDLLYLLRYWEESMEKDFEAFSVFLGKTGPSLIPYFRKTTYKNTVFRYLSFPPENLGLCWLITDKYFVLTFSGESIIKTIDKINE